MADFSIGKVQDLGDIQRTYTWRLILPPINGVTEEEMQIRCRSVVIPGRSQEVITSNYGGMEIHFPGRQKFTQPFNITFEEFADRKIASMLYYWQQSVFNTTVGGGLGKQNMNAHLQLTKYNTTDVPKSEYGLIKLNHVWPESVAEIPLSYADNTAIQYALALRYDSWEYELGA